MNELSLEEYKNLARVRFNLLSRAKGYFTVMLTDPDVNVVAKQIARQALHELSEKIE